MTFAAPPAAPTRPVPMAITMGDASGVGPEIVLRRAAAGQLGDDVVIFGDVAQTLTLRHVTTDRTSFMPGVLMAVRAVAGLPDRLTVGLERLLWP